jgi:acetoacetyl-CoA reductase/3-oxoacyl-[acyl-carrier protein] reductase
MSQPIGVVSGGTRGIGLGLSHRLCQLGYYVIAFYRDDHRTAHEARVGFEDRLETVQLDVSRSADVRLVCDQLLAKHGAPGVLVNNAGVNRDRPFLDLSDEDWSRVIDTNLSGPFYLTRALAPAMLQAGGGAIVNVAATTAIRPRLNGANYCASKAGLLQLTKCLALELAPTIRVNCLIPGVTGTEELIERYGLDDPDRRAAVLREIPLGRIATEADMADALEFLVSAQSRYFTGQKLIIDGGQFMW